MREAMPHIRELRARADADRPHLIAVQNVNAEWADAEDKYKAAVRQIQWAQKQLEQVRDDPPSDPLDIGSAQAEVRLRRMLLPSTTPAEQFYPALSAAMATPADAAGGADRIVSGDDVDALIAEANTADRRALRQAHIHRKHLYAELDRAERAAAAAFAEAETRSADHVLAQLDALRTELRVLEAAGRCEQAHPLAIPPTAVAGLPARTADTLTALARLPFTITPVAASPGRDTTHALHTLRAAANAAQRKVLWISPTQQQADQARADELADTTATIAAAHQHLTDTTWQLPPAVSSSSTTLHRLTPGCSPTLRSAPPRASPG